MHMVPLFATCFIDVLMFMSISYWISALEDLPNWSFVTTCHYLSLPPAPATSLLCSDNLWENSCRGTFLRDQFQVWTNALKFALRTWDCGLFVDCETVRPLENWVLVNDKSVVERLNLHYDGEVFGESLVSNSWSFENIRGSLGTRHALQSFGHVEPHRSHKAHNLLLAENKSDTSWNIKHHRTIIKACPGDIETS
jgi:hypothetical protein